MYIYNVKIHTMEEKTIENGYIKVENGKIAEIFEGILKNPTESDFDGQGYNLYPGFIDVHTHLGVFGNGLGFEAEDANEQTDPVTPQLRIIDAINPCDESFYESIASGVTSALVSPGSSNAICGEITAIKTASSRRIDDMIIKNVGMKFALGENPKSVYHDKDQTPVTRMATASLIRENLHKAKRYLADLEKSQGDEEIDPPEYDIKLEGLLPLLKGEISAHFHAHRADDIFTAIRIAKEFSLKYVIVHATEGHLIADILAKEGTKCIVGPIICDRCKPELQYLSTKNASVLHENGVGFAICTDHPETPLKYLSLSASIAAKSGLSRSEAIKSITINAAKIAEIDDRVGSIAVGKDADFVVTDGDPLEMFTEIKAVFSDGEIKVKNI